MHLCWRAGRAALGGLQAGEACWGWATQARAALNLLSCSPDRAAPQAAHPDKPAPPVTALAQARTDVSVIPTSTGALGC